MLSIAFRSKTAGEDGLFRSLASLWFAHRYGGWMLRLTRDKEERGRWLNSFELGDCNLDQLRDTLDKGLHEGHFFVSEELRRALRHRGHDNVRVYVEHAVPLCVLRSLIESRVRGTRSERKVAAVASRVLERHFTLGWILEKEKVLAKPQKAMPKGVEVCPPTCECRNARGWKRRKRRYGSDPNWSRYWVDEVRDGTSIARRQRLLKPHEAAAGPQLIKAAKRKRRD
jgi:hypothetical protein